MFKNSGLAFDAKHKALDVGNSGSEIVGWWHSYSRRITSGNKLTNANIKYLNQYGKSTKLVLDSPQSLIVSLKG